MKKNYNNFELVVIWETGEKEIHAYATEEGAQAVANGYKMVFGNQIAWVGIRKAVEKNEE